MVTRQQYVYQDQDPQQHTLLSSSDLQLVPFVPVDGEWILSDRFLFDVFLRTSKERLLNKVFWDESVTSAHDFISLCKNPQNILAFIFKEKECVGYAWLAGLSGNYSFAHFCFFPPIWGAQTIEAGHLYLKYWFSFEGDDGPLLDTLIGMIPGFNKVAHKFVERVGFERLGVIPEMLKNRRGDREDAVIFFKRR